MIASSSTIAGIVVLIVWLIAGFILYFLPSLIARSKHHHNTAAIFALNLLLGWTFIGWVIALVMALSNPPPREK